MKPKFKFLLGQIVTHKSTDKFGRPFIVLGRYHLEEIGCDTLHEMYNVRAEDTRIISMIVEELKEYNIDEKKSIGTVGDV